MDKKLLTDPYFGTWGHVAYARVAPPAMSREGLLGVDAVLISHQHWDHTDKQLLRELAEQAPVLVPNRTKWKTKLSGVKTVIGMNPWDQQQLGVFIVTAVPAVHLAVTVG